MIVDSLPMQKDSADLGGYQNAGENAHELVPLSFS